MPLNGQTTRFHNFEARAGSVILTLEPGANLSALASTLRGIGSIVRSITDGDAHAPLDPDAGPLRLILGQGAALEAVLDRLARIPGVRSAEPDYVLRTFDDLGALGAAGPGASSGVGAAASSNDPGFTSGQTWGLYGDMTAPANAFGSQAGEAWAGGYTGSSKVIVGLVDTGVDYTHPDLYLNIWLNPNEIPAALKAALADTDADGRIGFRDLNAAANAAYVSDLNANGRIDAGDLLQDARWEDGLDQDSNGRPDDLIGWDFLNNDNDPFDDVGHGTHVAGAIAGQGANATGVAGVTWSTQLIVAKFLGPNGGFTSGAVDALNYVTALHAAPGGDAIVATNNSWGGGGFSQALLDAIVAGANADILFITAAGNGGPDSVGDNNDATPNYPSNYDTIAGAGYDAVVAVASLTATGALSSFSNYGASSVDLGAPGSAIYSTTPGAAYGSKNGTSMATGFVTGAVALYAAVSPGASAAQIRADLLSTVAPTSTLADKTVTGGRLDVSALIYKISPAGVVGVGTSAADTFSLTAAPAGQPKASVFNDTLSGAAGDDRLDGGLGLDRLVGGPGNDSYTVDNAGDVIVELANEGNDLVTSSISQALGANVERLTLTGGAGLFGSGNELDNTIIGNNGANSLSGAGGNDILTGGAGADTLTGGAGNDRLTGGTEADNMAGGPGDDTYDVDVAGDVVTELAGEGNDLVNSAVSFVLGPTLERLTLTGTAAADGVGNDVDNTIIGNGGANSLSGAGGNDILTGGAGADTLTGGLGNDRLTGGAEADIMTGGPGDDSYDVDSLSDVVTELAGEGNDLVTSSVSFSLGSTLERLTLVGTAAADGVGNDVDNTLLGNGGANSLSGAGGNDILTGNGGADTLSGGLGNDRLTGGADADTMVGGPGDDTYDVDSLGDVVTELAGEGNDLVNSSVSFVLGPTLERLTLIGTAAADGTGNDVDNTIIGNNGANALSAAAGNDVLIGNAGADTLAGGLGNDRLIGGADADNMAGGPGDDTYDVDSLGDMVTEGAGEGIDSVSSTVTFVLGDNVEKLTLTGAVAANGTGNALNNTLTGNTGDNLLDGADGADTLTGGTGKDTLAGGLGNDSLTGGTGADSMAGGGGNDVYIVDDAGDVVSEAGGDGFDQVTSSVTFVLGDNIENLTLTSTGAANGTGNLLGNAITGGIGANILLGGGGGDTLNGGSGADTLNGGAGVDRISGGGDLDRYVLSKGEAAGDVIIDFAAGEKLELQGWGAGSTIVKVTGSLTDWTITDGVTAETEVITLSNRYNLVASDWIFT